MASISKGQLSVVEHQLGKSKGQRTYDVISSTGVDSEKWFSGRFIVKVMGSSEFTGFWSFVTTDDAVVSANFVNL